MSRILLVLVMLAATAGAVVAYGDPEQIARASDQVSQMLRRRALEPAPAVQIARGQAGEFALHAKINGVKAPMAEESPSILPETEIAVPVDEKRRARNKPIMSAGTGL